ncbi:trigger factor, partial [bacterium K02(2017)]
MTTSQVKDLSNTKKKISITIPKQKVSDYLQRAYQKIGQTAKINGFRKGKIPTTVLDKHYQAEINYELMNFIISDSYSNVLTTKNLNPVTEPKFDAQPVDREKDYSYSVEIEVQPEFELKDYKNIEVKKKKSTIKDEELENELKRLQESLAQLAPVKEDDTLNKGLVATIDFEGTIDGKSFDGGSAKDYTFEY